MQVDVNMIFVRRGPCSLEDDPALSLLWHPVHLTRVTSFKVLNIS